jgi:hypothetical protein
LLHFPKKAQKEELHLLLPENALTKMLREISNEAFKSGRRHGFFIGLTLTNVVNLIIQFVFKH